WIDAAMLSLFAERLRPEVRPLPDEATRDFEAHLARRRQVMDMLVAEKQRLATARAAVAKQIKAHIRYLERLLADVDRDLERTIASSPLWRAKDELLRSAKGVGPVFSRTLLAEVPELGARNRKRSEEHTSELQSRENLGCRLLLAKKSTQPRRG